MADITTFQWISISLGTTGTVLGLVNLYRSFRADSFRLEVVPGVFAETKGGKAVTTTLDKLPKGSTSDFPIDSLFRIGKLSATVRNFSKYPVYLSEFGLIGSKSVDRQALSDMQIEGGFPIKLEPLQSITAFRDSKHLINSGLKGKVRFYVKTQCGREVKGNSPAFKRWVEQVGTGQPAIRPQSKSEGSQKPKPESEGRSR